MSPGGNRRVAAAVLIASFVFAVGAGGETVAMRECVIAVFCQLRPQRTVTARCDEDFYGLGVAPEAPSEPAPEPPAEPAV